MFTIGVVRFSSLGDTVLVTPVLRALKSRYPEAQLSLMVKPAYAPVFFNNPHVDRTIEFDAQGRHRGLPGLYRFILEQRADEYDLLLDLHGTLRSRLITLGLRARRKMRYRKHHWRRRAMVRFRSLALEPRHVVDLYGWPLRRLGIEMADRRPEIFLTPEEMEEARLTLKENGYRSDGPLIGVHVGAGGRTKRWLPDYFRQVVAAFHEREGRVVLFGAGDDEPFVETICQGLRSRPMVLTSLSLRQTMALIERCAVLLCHDSGPMHLATALNVPVVALFGPTHPKLGFWPVGEENAVLTAEAACSPCSLHGTRPCSLERKICLEEISPARVTEALRRVLDREKEGADVAGGGSPLLPA